MTTTVILEGDQPRDTHAVPCPKCGGYAGDADPTPEEIKAHQTCGRQWACCLKAFVCQLCGERVLAHLEAPDMDLDW